jgi:hypothetical protein
VSGKEEISSIVNKYPTKELAAIFIPQSTSQRELITWIKENWSDIETGNNTLGKFQTRGMPKNLEIGIEIGALLDQGNTYSQISAILSEKYPKDERLADYNQVKIIYIRYKEYMVESMKSVIKLDFLHGNMK